MPHLPDDDYAPPPKVLRKRLNGVYREDLGFSGPTRRYVLTVAMLVGLASVPTLAVLTTGSSEITGDDRPGAMEVPFLPPPSTGPVRPAPIDPDPAPAPSTSLSKSPPRGYGQSTREPTPAGPSAPGSAENPDSASPGKGSPSSTSPVPSRTSATSRPAPPRKPTGTRTVPPRDAASHRPVSPGGPPPHRPDTSRDSAPDRHVAPRIPVVPDLPVVPEEDRIPEPVLPGDFPTVPGLPEVPDEPDSDRRESDPNGSGRPERGTRDRDGRNDRAHSNNSDEPPVQPRRRKPACENATAPHERSGRRHTDPTTSSSRPAGDPPRRDTESSRSAVHESRSSDRPRHSRRSAVADRPYNIRSSRILEQNHGGGDLNVVRRLLTDSNSEENRLANRPYRGQHRAEHTNYPDERGASYDRSSRVGRHHAEPNPDAPYINRR
ncbi:hypothetical protein Ait01nite_052200 [Actinoplanes italicus]|uniref:hypothetical protein n=1 Tax=Actinoplanes italicus TaxID=113567 RepID=UPI0011B1FAB0|nr:hypothetical protein [Actinoplanes italicus]GIE32175.1 hypothetical protein Ait01nite_052200 [Actinoplanes italicus]